MQLTLIKLFKDTVPGHIFRGKRRLVREVTPAYIRKKVLEYQQTESNMQLLMRPFLTKVSINSSYYRAK